ncbi:MAG TPA: hypothetical protein VFI08_00740 [Spirochaetia bacterium]|nr:hypothetical protein [Spirochaetia bacterium]
MTAVLRRVLPVLGLLLVMVLPAFSQADQPAADQSGANQAGAAQPAGGGFGFKMGMGIGVQTFNDDPIASPNGVTYQSISLAPDISFGKFGIGLDLALNYNFTGPNNAIHVRQEDWWPTNGVTFQHVMQIYLPKFAYIRWGEKGDPLFLKAGSFNDATLGSGFIMGDYNNMLFLPTERHFGLQADVDGALFNFPYVGVETVVGNLAVWDVMGARVYARPLVNTPIPILNQLEVGLTVAADTNPYFETATAGSASTIAVVGLGAQAPVVYQKDIFSMIAYTDVADIQGKTWGSMAGVGGRIINIFTWGAQLRLMGAGFIPTYFGPGYDTQRDQQYAAIQDPGTGTTFGGLATLGTSLLGDKLVFKVELDTPFVTPETDPLLARPHLNAILTLAPNVLPVFSFDFMYDKKGIGTFSELVDATNATIQAKLNLASGPAVISFVYDITYDRTHSPDPWVVTSGLQSSIALF